MRDAAERARRRTRPRRRSDGCRCLEGRQVEPPAAEAAYTAFGQLDILVNNAGVTHMPVPLDEISEADFDRVLAVNVKSVYLTARRLGARYEGGEAGGRSSISPRPPPCSHGHASPGTMPPRAGWSTATKSMAVELAPLGIRVNALNPVAGETPLLKTFMGEDTPRDPRQVPRDHPARPLLDAGRHGQRRLLPLLRRSRMITGVALEVDGGRVI